MNTPPLEPREYVPAGRPPPRKFVNPWRQLWDRLGGHENAWRNVMTVMNTVTVLSVAVAVFRGPDVPTPPMVTPALAAVASPARADTYPPDPATEAAVVDVLPEPTPTIPPTPRGAVVPTEPPTTYQSAGEAEAAAIKRAAERAAILAGDTDCGGAKQDPCPDLPPDEPPPADEPPEVPTPPATGTVQIAEGQGRNTNGLTASHGSSLQVGDTYVVIVSDSADAAIAERVTQTLRNIAGPEPTPTPTPTPTNASGGTASG